MASSKLCKPQNRPLVPNDFLSSNLTKDLKERILTYLPIKEAGRTSILSRKWRYVWASTPDIIFGNEGTSLDMDKFVDAIFVLHKGPIRRFNLSTGRSCYPEAFDRWIVNLSRNGIRELTLGFSTGNNNLTYMMHSEFFSCDELTYINLKSCSFRVPNEFSGFKSLHTLELNYLKISDGEIEKLISRCPLLKKLKLQYWSTPVSDVIALKIDAPNLLNLEICGTFSNLQLCAPKLRFLCLELENGDEHNTSKSLEKILGNLPELEYLELCGFLEYLCVGPLGEGFPLTFNHLKYLNIVLNFQFEEEGPFALALFKGATHLQSLHINVCCEIKPASRFWERVDRKVSIFKHLQTVKIVYIFADTLLSFVKFVLDYAPQLETLTIEEEFKYEEIDESDAMVLKQIPLLGRASPNAQIIFK